MRTKPRSLRVGFFNINGIREKRAELNDFVRTHNIDVFLIQETFLKPSQRSPKLANYRHVRNDRTNSMLGGTLIYYKNSLHCIPLDPPVGLRNIEASVCRLSMTGHSPITIASVYLSPSKELLVSDVDLLLGSGESVLLAGDLNAKNVLWNCNSTNSKGRVLEGILDQGLLNVLAPSEPTHYSHIDDLYRPDILDVALVRNVCLRVSSMQVLHELDSDHRPVILDLVPLVVPNDTGLNANDSVSMKVKTDWRLLGATLADTSSSELSEIPDNIATPEETTGAIRSFTKHLQHAVSKSSKKVPEAELSQWYLPESVKCVVRRRNAAVKACARDPNPDRRGLARFLQREARRRITQAVDTRWENHITDIKPTQMAFWQLCRSFRRNDISSMPPLNRPNQRPAFEDDEKAELLADSLESQCSLSSVPVDHDHLVAIDTYVESRIAQYEPSPPPPPSPDHVVVDPEVDPPLDPLAPVTLEEVTTLIKALKRRKAPGADGIATRVLKMLPEHLLTSLVKIFNAAFRNSLFPQQWKEAVVIGFHKPGKPATEPSSYRPISLLSTLGKLYERIILDRLRIVSHLHRLLPEEQFGFRQRHSCLHQILRITEHTQIGFFRGLTTGALFFDVEKAFDRVWHNGLLYKLFTLNVPTQLVLIIRDFLSNRGFRYRVEGTLSSRHTITAGVPQGSALSPLLFSLYTSDIPRPRDAHLALYADDTALFTSRRDPSVVIQSLQAAADALGEWFRKWRITINPLKSQAILFSRRHFLPVPRVPITMSDQPIPWSPSVKYLGVILDQRLTFGPHVNAVRARAAFAMSQLYWLLNKNSKMSRRNKIRIFTTCVRPIMTYASPAFAHINPNRLERLQIVQNKFLRQMLDAPWYVRNRNLHVDTGMPTIRHVMQTISRRYFDRAAHHSNTLIRRASIYTPFDRAKWRRPRSVLTDPDDETTLAIKHKDELLKLLHSTRPQYRPRRRGPRRVPRPPDSSRNGPRAEVDVSADV